jgi:hypothetical protein
MGSIYRRGSVFWIQYYRHGKLYRETARTQKENEVKRLLKLGEGEIAEGKIPGVHFDKVRLMTLQMIF